MSYPFRSLLFPPFLLFLILYCLDNINVIQLISTHTRQTDRRTCKNTHTHTQLHLNIAKSKQNFVKYCKHRFLILLYHRYNKITRCLFVCLYQRTSLTSEPIRFSYKVASHRSRKGFSYFRGGYHHPRKRNHKNWI